MESVKQILERRAASRGWRVIGAISVVANLVTDAEGPQRSIVEAKMQFEAD